MPGFDPSNVNDVFNRLRDLFNSGQYDQMKQFLHDDITWKMLHHADSISGADAVVQWLNDNKASLMPQFLPEVANTTVDPDRSVRIDGSAHWQGKKGPPNEGLENIEYHFTFENQSGSWLLKNAFGVVVG